ncbi:hypothetical protein L596_023264 [Steinernema carpocapsae]|uniref:Fatty-acid and retinol-binding protein 1 n=1 Tax=Steinernema carpocapsae TaxID=34508 RepID=A0A4U5MD63_STECR|nr:hypothetical protein L596_023264 [Steinernema carpocapsae]
MLSTKIFLLFLVSSSYASDGIGELIGNQLGDVIPPETKKFYNSLTSEDKGVLEDVMTHISKFSNMTSLLDELKGRSLPLFNKATEFLNIFKGSYDELSDKAKLFIDQEIAQVRRIAGEPFSVSKIRDEVNGIIRRFKALDDDTEFELRNAFPTVSTVLYNPILQAIAGTVLGIGGGQSITDGSHHVNPEYTTTQPPPPSAPESTFEPTPASPVQGDNIEEPFEKVDADTRRR